MPAATLATPVELLQHEGEFRALLELYRQRNPQVVLELGTGQGGSLYHWLQNAQPGALIVAVDRVPQPDRWRTWISGNVRLAIIRGDTSSPETQHAAEQFGPYDWIFIDADHHEPNVRADWNAYRAMAAPGAAIALHDISPSPDPTIEVDPLWQELRERYWTLEFIEPGGYGIGVVLLPEAP